MTLRQQFSMLTTVLVIVLLMGSLVLSIINGRDAFEQQLNARAYDAATSLALAMSQVPNQDEVELSRQIDVLFDRGFFSDITFTDVHGNQLYRREHQALAHQPAPGWFRSLVSFNLLPAETDVTTGWTRMGTVSVSSHTDFAYRDLWNMIQDQAIWFMAVLVVSLVALQLLLRWLFKPVAEVEDQALAICDRQWRVLDNIPNVIELKNMVLAMNKMVIKLQTMFNEQSETTERLRQESFADELSGMQNRRGFDQRLEYLLRSNEEHCGLLMLMQIEDFADYNQREGRKAGDEVIVLTADSVQQWQQDYGNSFSGRHAGADFTVYVPVANRAHADELIQHFYSHMASTALSQRIGLAFHVGGVFLQGQQDTLSSALMRADEALRQAQRHPRGRALLYYQDYGNTAELSATEWSELLKNILREEELELQYMPVVRSTQGQFELQQLEVYSRVRHRGELISAARFWPMVEQHQMAAAFDITVIRKVMEALDSGELCKAGRVCINLSPASVLDRAFHEDVMHLLKQHPEAGRKLAFELPEYSIGDVETQLQGLAHEILPAGVVFGVDQVGTGTAAFSYMQRLPIEYVRIDGSLNRGLFDAQDQRFFTQSMVHIGHSLDLMVFGEGLEQGVDVDELYRSGIDGVSGYFYCKPQPSITAVAEWSAGFGV